MLCPNWSYSCSSWSGASPPLIPRCRDRDPGGPPLAHQVSGAISRNLPLLIFAVPTVVPTTDRPGLRETQSTSQLPH